MWRKRRWRDLLNLIDWLPRDSAFMEAMSEDEELAENLLRQPRGKTPGHKVRISEFSPLRETLSDLYDRQGEIVQAIIAAAGAKPPKLKPYPRPRTALDRLRDKHRYEKHRSTVARVLRRDPDAPSKPLPGAQPPPASTKFVPKKVALLPGENPFRMVTRGGPPPEEPKAE